MIQTQIISNFKVKKLTILIGYYKLNGVGIREFPIFKCRWSVIEKSYVLLHIY